MPEDHLRFRCYRCNQLLGASSRRAGAVITCPKCGAELKVPRPEEQTVAAEASRSGQGYATDSRLPVGSSTSTVEVRRQRLAFVHGRDRGGDPR